MQISELSQSHDLIVYCPALGCDHSISYSRSEAIERFGGDMDIDRLRNYGRCEVCGHRGAGLTVQFSGSTGGESV